MRILAKNGVYLEGLIDKSRKGGEQFELHMLQTDILNREVDEMMQELGGFAPRVRIVHVPIERKYSVECLNGGMPVELHKIFKLATKCGELHNTQERMVVVFHMEMGVTELRTWGLLSNIVRELRTLLYTYPLVDVVFENLMPVCLDNKKVFFANNYYLDTFELVRTELIPQLGEELGNRVGVVFDVCHYLATTEWMAGICGLGVEGEQLESILTFMQRSEFKETVKVIHLANSRNMGVYQDHGVGFDTEVEVQRLHSLLQVLSEMDYAGYLTLEVQEDDYSNSQVFEKLNSQILKWKKHQINI